MVNIMRYTEDNLIMQPEDYLDDEIHSKPMINEECQADAPLIAPQSTLNEPTSEYCKPSSSVTLPEDPLEALLFLNQHLSFNNDSTNAQLNEEMAYAGAKDTNAKISQELFRLWKENLQLKMQVKVINAFLKIIANSQKAQDESSKTNTLGDVDLQNIISDLMGKLNLGNSMIQVEKDKMKNVSLTPEINSNSSTSFITADLNTPPLHSSSEINDLNNDIINVNMASNQNSCQLNSTVVPPGFYPRNQDVNVHDKMSRSENSNKTSEYSWESISSNTNPFIQPWASNEITPNFLFADTNPFKVNINDNVKDTPRNLSNGFNSEHSINSNLINAYNGRPDVKTHSPIVNEKTPLTNCTRPSAVHESNSVLYNRRHGTGENEAKNVKDYASITVGVQQSPANEVHTRTSALPSRLAKCRELQDGEIVTSESKNGMPNPLSTSPSIKTPPATNTSSNRNQFEATFHETNRKWNLRDSWVKNPASSSTNIFAQNIPVHSFPKLPVAITGNCNGQFTTPREYVRNFSERDVPPHFQIPEKRNSFPTDCKVERSGKINQSLRMNPFANEYTNEVRVQNESQCLSMNSEQDNIDRRNNITSNDMESPLMFQEVALINTVVYLFYYKRVSWISTDEFIDSFTYLKTPEKLFNLLGLLALDIPFVWIKRSQYPNVFSQLDSTSLKTQRDENKNIRSILLMPLEYSIKVLARLQTILPEDVKKITNEEPLLPISIVHNTWILLKTHETITRQMKGESQRKPVC